MFLRKTSLFLTLALLLVWVWPAASQEKTPPTPVITNQTTELRPDLQPDDRRFTVGEHGYKVFHPGAIGQVNITTEANAVPQSYIRTGTSDAWLAWSWSWDWQQWGWDHFGGHESTSEEFEQAIWADGHLKITTDHNWRESCTNHTSGPYAYCSTHFFQLLPRTIKARSYHYFHKQDVLDDNFYTEDSA